MATTEKKVSHTPGPWFQSHVEDRNDGMYYTRVYDHKDIIATIHWYPVQLGDGVTGTRREANAKLIAAAPELLKALQGLVLYFEFMVRDPQFKEYVDGIEAIKKATE